MIDTTGAAKGTVTPLLVSSRAGGTLGRPALTAAKVIGKNLLGVVLVLLGIVLSLPGVPGQGLLTVLLGIMLLDFPGIRRLEQKLLTRPTIINAITRLRQRFGKPPLELE